MAGKPRLFLFYGTDSRGSLLAVQKWARIFQNKYGDSTRYILDADELGADQLRKSLAEILEGQTLFSAPKLIIIKRLSSLDRAPSYAASKEVVAQLKSQLAFFDDTVTLAIWEDRNLRPDHPLYKSFSVWKAEEVAELRKFTVPTDREVARVAKSYLTQAGRELQPEAVTWVQQQYEAQGKRTRLQKKLKAGEEPLQEERAWWLYQVLEGAVLRTEKVVNIKDLQAGAEQLSVAVSPFEIATALGNKSWKETVLLLDRFAAGDDADYFSLLAALRWYFRKNVREPLALPALELLAEIELLSKNFSLDFHWLFTLFLHRLIKVSRGQRLESIIPPRRLWLAQLYRP